MANHPHAKRTCRRGGGARPAPPPTQPPCPCRPRFPECPCPRLCRPDLPMGPPEARQAPSAVGPLRWARLSMPLLSQQPAYQCRMPAGALQRPLAHQKGCSSCKQMLGSDREQTDQIGRSCHSATSALGNAAPNTLSCCTQAGQGLQTHPTSLLRSPEEWSA